MTFLIKEKMTEQKQQTIDDISSFHAGEYYRVIKSPDIVMFVMGKLLSYDGKETLISQIYLYSMDNLDYTLSIQGTPVIKKEEWEKITKEEFETAIQFKDPGMMAFSESAKKFI